MRTRTIACSAAASSSATPWKPREGAWGVTRQASYFEVIKAAGFDSVRILIRWPAHAATELPYEINPAFFKRVDWVSQQALSR
jgi:endoglucanase